MIKYYHIVSDDSYWSTADAVFVAHDSIPTDIDVETEITDLPDLSELKVCLEFYGFPLGEMELPEERQAREEAMEIDSIKARLNALDIGSVRPLRAIVEGKATDFDRQKLQDIETEAADLRRRFAELRSA